MSRSNGTVCGDELKQINEEVDAVIWSGNDKRKEAKRLVAGWREAESEGDDDASAIINVLAEKGLLSQFASRNRKGSGVIVNVTTGDVVSVPTHASVPIRASDGSETGGRQLQYWRTLSWSEFREWADGQIRLSRSMDVKAQGLRKVLSLQAEFPNSKNPEQACELAGIDPDSLELDAA